MYGKEARLKRIINQSSGRTIIVPMDHGATMGPMTGLKNIKKCVQSFPAECINGIVVCKGQMTDYEFVKNCQVPIFVHLSNSNVLSPAPNFKTLMGSVENAIALGADAISVHINIGDDNEHQMLHDLGKVADDCFKWGMPLLAMMYVRAHDSAKNVNANIKIAARIAAESGADIVKVNYTGSIDTFREVVEGCHVPIIIAGGNISKGEDVLQMAADAIEAGAIGIACGRNVFQSKNADMILKALNCIIHKNMSVQDAAKILEAQ